MHGGFSLASDGQLKITHRCQFGESHKQRKGGREAILFFFALRITGDNNVASPLL